MKEIPLIKCVRTIQQAEPLKDDLCEWYAWSSRREYFANVLLNLRARLSRRKCQYFA